MNYDQYKRLEITKRNNIATVALHRPEARNAVDGVMHFELSQIFYDLQMDDEVHCVVVTGTGDAFCAGGDIGWLLKTEEPLVVESKKIFAGLLDLEKPVIARVKGPAVGLGATLALFCDMVYATEDAKIADTHVRVGLSAGDGGSIIWPALIGFARAKRYLFTGDVVTGKEAAAMGLITEAVPPDQLDDVVYGLAERLVKGPRKAISYTKASVNVWLKELFYKLIDTGAAYETLCWETPDFKNATQAFLRKEKPVFGQRRR